VQAGEKVTGVTVAFTVRAMDAGPIVAQEEVEVDPNVKVGGISAGIYVYI
jgi:methionyl-tRNA formyltransferase